MPAVSTADAVVRARSPQDFEGVAQQSGDIGLMRGQEFRQALVVGRRTSRKLPWAHANLFDRLWLFYLPFLFLPNLGLGRETAFGKLELSDYLIGPYLVCLWIASSPARRQRVQLLMPLIAAFLAVAAISTLSMPWRYAYPSLEPFYFSLLKLAKLTLYGYAGLMTARRIRGAEGRRRFHWALLGVLAGLGGSLLAMRPEQDPLREAAMAAQGYKSDNAISVALAVLACYVGALLATRYGTHRWRRTAALVIAVGLLGSFVSSGRGGWLAAGAGLLYLLWRRQQVKAAAGVTAGLFLLGVVGYLVFPEFKYDVDRTLKPDPDYVAIYGAGLGGIDDGGRVAIWLFNVPRILEEPVLGTGFFHRGGLANHPFTGSHNFFLQMFLETGIAGGLLVLAIFQRLWKDAGAAGAEAAKLTIPLRAALVAAVVGGMGGEYFYGGITLLALLAVYAPVGGLPAMPRLDHRKVVLVGREAVRP
jgi:O-antigen ligase